MFLKDQITSIGHRVHVSGTNMASTAQPEGHAFALLAKHVALHPPTPYLRIPPLSQRRLRKKPSDSLKHSFLLISLPLRLGPEVRSWDTFLISLPVHAKSAVHTPATLGVHYRRLEGEQLEFVVLISTLWSRSLPPRPSISALHEFRMMGKRTSTSSSVFFRTMSVLSARQAVMKDNATRGPRSLCLMGGPRSPGTPARHAGGCRRLRSLKGLFRHHDRSATLARQSDTSCAGSRRRSSRPGESLD